MGAANVKEYRKTYTSFSGTDIIANIILPPEINDGGPMTIGQLQTVSVSIHREVNPVRVLGNINPVGVTGGGRTIAGSLIFTVFDRNIVYDIQKKISTYLQGKLPQLEKKMNEGYKTMSNDNFSEYAGLLKQRIHSLSDISLENLKNNAILMDEMPPFDIQITMRNEYGQAATMVLYGVIIVDEGQVMSIEDMITENTMSYIAMGIRHLKDESNMEELELKLIQAEKEQRLANVCLKNITTNYGKLQPEFNKDILTYKILVPKGYPEPTITYEKENQNSHVAKFTGDKGIDLSVTSEDHKSTTMYSILFEKETDRILKSNYNKIIGRVGEKITIKLSVDTNFKTTDVTNKCEAIPLNDKASFDKGVIQLNEKGKGQFVITYYSDNDEGKNLTTVIDYDIVDKVEILVDGLAINAAPFKAGTQFQLKVVTKDSNGSKWEITKKCTYNITSQKSTDDIPEENICSIDGNGYLKLLNPGKAILSINFNNNTCIYNINVI